MTDVERAVTRRVLERKKKIKNAGLAGEGRRRPRRRAVNQPLSNTVISAALLVVPFALSLRMDYRIDFFDEHTVWIVALSACGLVFGQTVEAVFLPLLLASTVGSQRTLHGFPSGYLASDIFKSYPLNLVMDSSHATRGLFPGLPLILTLSWILHYVAQTSISSTECVLIGGGVTTLLLSFRGKLYQAVLVCGLLPFCATAVYLRRYISILRRRRPDNDAQLMNRLAVKCYFAYLISAAVLFVSYLLRNGRFFEFFALIGIHWRAFAWWLSCLGLGFLVAARMLRDRASMLDSRRKLWHLTVVCMFWRKISSGITPVAMATAIILFLVLEAVRAAALPPLGKPIHEAFRSFVDERDTCGPLVISHIYLLMGIAWPVFISGNSLACSRAGLICLGLGDTLASQIGRRFGRLRIFGDKSLEGTVGFFVAAFCGLRLSQVPTAPAAIAAAATALLEATSIINDNLVLPSYMVAILSLMRL